MGDQNHPSTQIIWRIPHFASLTESSLCSDIFTVGGTKWLRRVYPKGEGTEHLSVYLEVADLVTLPSGWRREAMLHLTLVNQLNGSLSKELKFGAWKNFNSNIVNWGYRSIIPLHELEDVSRGFLVDEAVVLGAKADVRRVHPPITITSTLFIAPSVADKSTDKFDTYFANLEKFIIGDSTSTICANLNSQKKLLLNSKIPSLEDVEQAKQSLKECLSDLYKMNMKERLAKALLTLSLVQDGLSSDQQKAVRLFLDDFDDFTLDLLVLEQDNSKFELQKLLKDKSFVAIKENHKRHLSIKRSHSELCKEERELKKRLNDINFEKNNLMAEWESLLAESKKLQSSHKILENKVTKAEEKKSIAEERMSRSTAAWANLKIQFG